MRGGIKTVVIPKDNEKDLAEIPDNVKKPLEIFPVATVDEVLRRALVRQPEPIEWAEVEPERLPAPAESGPEPPAHPASPAGPLAAGAETIRGAGVFPLRFRDREQYQRAFERDISTGGLFISTERPPALDTVIEVEVGIDGHGGPPVRLQARVVHRMETPPGSPPGNLLAGMGVQFLDVRRAVEQLRTLL